MPAYETILKQVAAATDRGKRLLKSLVASAKLATQQSTSTLFGVIGGSAGLGIAYGLSIAFPVVSLPVAGTFLSVFGVAGGVLAYRGPRRISLEQQIDDEDQRAALCQRRANEALAQIRKLEKLKNPPPDVLASLWKSYGYWTSVEALRPPRITGGSPPGKDSTLAIEYSTNPETVTPKIRTDGVPVRGDGLKPT